MSRSSNASSAGCPCGCIVSLITLPLTAAIGLVVALTTLMVKLMIIVGALMGRLLLWLFSLTPYIITAIVSVVVIVSAVLGTVFAAIAAAISRLVASLWRREAYGTLLTLTILLLIGGFVMLGGILSTGHGSRQYAPASVGYVGRTVTPNTKPFPSALPTAPRTLVAPASTELTSPGSVTSVIASAVDAVGARTPGAAAPPAPKSTVSLTVSTAVPTRPVIATPTTSPTSRPTQTPTQTPTTTPTRRPTATPTRRPTATPTATSPPIIRATVLTGANLRSGPGTDFSVIGGASAGEVLTVIGFNENRDWVHLSNDAWIFAQLVQIATPSVQPQLVSADVPVSTGSSVTGWAVVQTTGLNVRQAPALTAPILAELTYGECVAVVAVESQWLQVRYRSDATGWCWREYLRQTDICPTPAPFVASRSSGQVPTYVNRPFQPNTTVVGNTNIHECFGSGDTPLRAVSAGTPVEVLGVGAFQPPAGQQEALGGGPFVKIRLWDGQVAWMPQSAVRVDVTALPTVTGACEAYDRMNWAQVRVNQPPTPTPVWSTSTQSAPSQACCKICRKGKACGDTCISHSYTCHVGPGCACNG